MIKTFVDRWEQRKEFIRAKFAANHPEDYAEVVKNVIEELHDPDTYSSPDPTRITEIDHGDYQGTLLYIIASSGYQPSTYWAVKIFYGSCSGCDTLQGIRGYSDKPPTEEQTKEYMMLALHIVQGLKLIGEEEE